MKNILIALAFLMALPLGMYGQKQSIRQFYRQYKKAENTTNFVLPGFLIRLGTGLARDMVKTEQEFEMLKLARSIRQARILVAEDHNPVAPEDFKGFINQIRNTNFDDMISVRDEGTNVQVMVQEDGKKIKGLLILVSEEDTFVMLHLKTKLKYKDINRLIELFRDELPIKKEEPKPKPEVPQV